MCQNMPCLLAYLNANSSDKTFTFIHFQGDRGAHGVPGHTRRHLPDLFQSWESHEDCDIHQEQHFPGIYGPKQKRR